MKTPLKENRVLLKSYVLPHEKKEIEALANQLNLSASAFVARLVVGKELPNVSHNQDLKDLIKVNGDLARLGNLLKMALDAGEFEANQYNKGTDVDSLIRDIRQTQNIVKTKVKMIRAK